MGSSRREQGRRSNEVLKPVRLTRPFYMGAREVTNREFREFMPSHSSGAFKNQDLNRDDLPAVMVSWEQAALFCNWLSVKESLPPVYVQREGRVVAAGRPAETVRPELFAAVFGVEVEILADRAGRPVVVPRARLGAAP